MPEPLLRPGPATSTRRPGKPHEGPPPRGQGCRGPSPAESRRRSRRRTCPAPMPGRPGSSGWRYRSARSAESRSGRCAPCHRACLDIDEPAAIGLGDGETQIGSPHDVAVGEPPSVRGVASEPCSCATIAGTRARRPMTGAPHVRADVVRVQNVCHPLAPQDPHERHPMPDRNAMSGQGEHRAAAALHLATAAGSAVAVTHRSGSNRERSSPVAILAASVSAPPLPRRSTSVRTLILSGGAFERGADEEGRPPWWSLAAGRHLAASQERRGRLEGGLVHRKQFPHTFHLPPPWRCALAQGQTASLLARLYRELGYESLADGARRVLLPLRPLTHYRPWPDSGRPAPGRKRPTTSLPSGEPTPPAWRDTRSRRSRPPARSAPAR